MQDGHRHEDHMGDFYGMGGEIPLVHLHQVSTSMYRAQL